MYLHVFACIDLYMQIQANTCKYIPIRTHTKYRVEIRVQYTHDLYWHVFLVLVCIVFANTSKIHANTSQYRPNTLMTG